MKTIIIEDEKPAAEKLQKAILNNHPGVEVAGVLNSIEAATYIHGYWTERWTFV